MECVVQMDGLLHRCECFLLTTRLPFLEKVWLADRYQLNRLLSLLLRELRPPGHKIDLSGSRYHGLSDRVKVMLLERIQGSQPPEVRSSICLFCIDLQTQLEVCGKHEIDDYRPIQFLPLVKLPFRNSPLSIRKSPGSVSCSDDG